MVNTTGILRNDSPRLFRELQRVLSPEHLVATEQIFKLCVEAGASEEPEILRAESVSYNPLPARVCHILITETKVGVANTLQLAIVACCDAEKIPSDPQIEPFREPALKVQRLCEGQRVEVPLPAVQIACAIILDELRHLHMNSLDPVSKAMRIEQIENILPLLLDPSCTKIIKMIELCIERFRS